MSKKSVIVIELRHPGEQAITLCYSLGPNQGPAALPAIIHSALLADAPPTITISIVSKEEE